MPLKILFNDVWKNSAQLLVTDGADAATTDYAGIESIARGPRHLEWIQSGTGVRRLVYVNKAGTLSANYCYIARADRMTSGYAIRKYSAYPASPTTIESSGSVPTCIGLNTDDYFTSFTLATNQQAFSVEFLGSMQKTVNKIFMGTTLDFDYVEPVRISPFWSIILVRRHVYHVMEKANFVLTNVSNSTLQTLQAAYKRNTEPCVIYDPDGTLIAKKSFHCIITNLQTGSVFNDINTVQIEACRLREYPLVA